MGKTKKVDKKKKVKVIIAEKHNTHFVMLETETIMVVFKCMILSPLSKTKKNIEALGTILHLPRA